MEALLGWRPLLLGSFCYYSNNASFVFARTPPTVVSKGQETAGWVSRGLWCAYEAYLAQEEGKRTGEEKQRCDSMCSLELVWIWETSCPNMRRWTLYAFCRCSSNFGNMGWEGFWTPLCEQMWTTKLMWTTQSTSLHWPTYWRSTGRCQWTCIKNHIECSGHAQTVTIRKRVARRSFECHFACLGQIKQ